MTFKIDFAQGDYASAEADVLAIIVTDGALERQRALEPVDRALDGALLAHADRVEFLGRAEQVLDLPTLGAIPARRVVLVGAGPRRGLGTAALRAAAANAARAAMSDESLALVMPDKITGADEARALGEGLGLGAYAFTKYLTGERVPKRQLARAHVYKTPGRPTAAEKKALALGREVAVAVNLTRNAVNEPPNELTPEALASIARQIAKQGKLKVTVLDEKALEKAGMNLHVAVGQGSAHPPRLIHLTYSPARPKKTMVFVGKGLTFDSGGLCIKPAAGMGDMKSDMGGAGAVLGVMAAVAALRPNVAVHGIIGAAENMPDGAAYRPSDVFASLDGKTVEVINTDAEGRLVLADALAYARKIEPDLLVDAATLTGACMVALGKTCSAFYTADDRLAKQVDRAAQQAGEAFWRMPLLEELREQLKSDVADLKHTGERWGGSITAALFLREFVGDTPWIHCDIPGAVLGDKPRGIYPKGATGHPVLTFLSLIESFK